MQPPDQPGPQDPNPNPLPGAGSSNPPPPMPGDVPPMPGSSEVSSDDRTLGMVAHISGAFTCFIGPLIVWIMKKDQPGFVLDQAKEALNFQITAFIVYVGTVVVASIPILGWLLSCLLMPALIIAALAAMVLSIVAGLKAGEGISYRYPLALRLVT